MRVGLCAKISSCTKSWLDLLELNSAERSTMLGTPRCESGQLGSLRLSGASVGLTEEGRLKAASAIRATLLLVVLALDDIGI